MPGPVLSSNIILFGDRSENVINIYTNRYENALTAITENDVSP